MASINQYPPVTPPPAPVPPPYRSRRSITGPVILIAIGVIFLLANLHVIHGWQFWTWFGHWWPILIIAWGLLALFEHWRTQPGQRTRSIGAGGIVLLVFIVIAGVIAHETAGSNWGNVRDQLQMDDDDLGIFGDPYTFEETLDQSFPNNGDLRIVCDRGTLNITTADDEKIHVVVHKKLYAHAQDDANKYNEGTKPEITVNGSSVLLNANTDGAGDHGVTADMDISLPAGAAIDVAAKRGDVTINERKAGVKITLQHGDVALTQITGPVAVSLEKGSVRATQITGDVDISGRVDSASIEEVSGAVRLNGDFYEDVRLSKIAKTVTFKTSRSDMQFASIPGDLDIASDQVRGSELSGPSRVVTSSKDIHLENVSGDLDVQSNNGDVEITTGGKGPAGKMSLATEHGDVALTVAGTTPPDKVNVATQHGDVTLTLASGVGFQVNAVTDKGGITSEFDSVKVNDTNGASKASGTVGNGSSKLQVATETGDIKIGKS